MRALTADIEAIDEVEVFGRVRTVQGLLIEVVGPVRELRVGGLVVNGTSTWRTDQLAYGGVKASGYGRFGGQAGVEEFTDLRWITIETQAGHFPL